MEVVNPRSALLSNYEVLTLLRELESDHLARTKTIQRIKKEEEAAGSPSSHGAILETSENLRTIEVEAIGYLGADYLPTAAQTPERITKLVKGLEPYELTKAEKLQIVNLAPTTAVELYVIVEELEDRLGDRMDDLLAHTKAVHGASAATLGTTNGTGTLEARKVIQIEETWDNNVQTFDDDADAVYDEEMFDDTGEGAGVEGDLDIDED